MSMIPVRVTTEIIEVDCKDWRGRPTTRWTTGYCVHLPTGSVTTPMRRRDLYAYAEFHNFRLEYETCA
jgi:DNA-binding transcriptional MocR family regulator